MLTAKPKGCGSQAERSLRALASVGRGLRIKDVLEHGATVLANVGDTAASLRNRSERNYSEFDGG